MIGSNICRAMLLTISDMVHLNNLLIAAGAMEDLTTSQKAELKELLLHYEALFQEPHQLPPQRKYDHKITLLKDNPVEYLGHIISAQGVALDPAKVDVVITWTSPTNVKQLRGFLGISGYYKRFIQNYGKIAQALTNLLKKDAAFQWTKEVEEAFQKLKRALTKAPVLALPNFDDEFTIEIDASGQGIVVVLLQKGHPVAFISRAMGVRYRLLSTYDKEFCAILFAVKKMAALPIRKSFQGSILSKWTAFLALAEYWYNTKFHSSTQVTPFQTLYGYPPILNTPLLVSDSMIQAVDYIVKTRDEISTLLKKNLQQAQDKMKVNANKKRTEKEYKVGDLVYLKLQPYKQTSLPSTSFHKLVARYFSPFKVLERIGQVAYKLELPQGSKIHYVFHISLLKKCHGHNIQFQPLPNYNEDGDLEVQPIVILDRRMKKKANRAVT
ncbi:uncharacterized protein LOC113867584 [Abrus precatorius]|uniref:Uncharacterized protein LOC113867584 n=1 Tax=Abrus precatorius TaxID=3816 RepID=A0A8B8LTH9_ABRPR|nr:uncharacterized protein LOC113867584 [Abrus precatorius]